MDARLRLGVSDGDDGLGSNLLGESLGPTHRLGVTAMSPLTVDVSSIFLILFFKLSCHYDIPNSN